jgi:WD40 repeat protein
MESDVSRIFLSHSSGDSRQAVALKLWLLQQRPELANEIFVDLDPQTGLRLGEHWKAGLFKSASRCESVICLLSNSWVASSECKTEYRTAEGLGKQILVARLEDLGDTDITSQWQRCDLFADGAQTEIEVQGGPPVRFNTAALSQIRRALEGTGVGPQSFVWPPTDGSERAPYRGWVPFEDIDAGVFFGRDAAIARGLDELRAMRFGLLAQLSGLKSMFVVLGPSGSGKSSFLRAGLIPRLQREDRRFVVLGTMRPERNALTGDHGLAAAIDTARRAHNLPAASLGEIKAACLHDPDRVIELLKGLRAAAAQRLVDTGQSSDADDATSTTEAGQQGGVATAPTDDAELGDGAASELPADANDETSAPTLVLPLDQAEELFSADAGEQAEQFLTLLTGLIARINASDLGLIVAATIRTDRYEVMQNHPALDGIGTVLFDELKPMPPTQFSEVITGPAARASEAGHRLSVAPDLVTRLLADSAEGADTLPLLALTLARLYTDYASNGELTAANYAATGGMRDVVNNEIEQILAGDPHERSTALALLRAAFIPWLATINPDNDQPVRRVTRESDLPDTDGLIEAFVAKRLLVRDERGGEVVVEVALESLLRQWDELAGWLRDERQNLKTADDIEHDSNAWTARVRDPSWLLTGTRLVDAETLAETPGFRERLGGTGDYLRASRKAEDQRLESEEQRRQAELRTAQERQQSAEAHSRVLRRILVGTAVIAVIAVVAAGVAFFARQQSQRRFQEAVAARVASDGSAILAGQRPGSDVQGLEEVIAAQRIDPRYDGELLDAQVERFNTAKLIDTGRALRFVAVSPDGHHIAASSDDDVVRFWNADTGKQEDHTVGGSNGVAYSPRGDLVATASGRGAGTVRLWSIQTGQLIKTLTGPSKTTIRVTFDHTGAFVASGAVDGSAWIWNVTTGASRRLAVGGGKVLAVAFSPTSPLLATGGDDGKIRIWNSQNGDLLRELNFTEMGAVQSLSFSPDGTMLAAGSNDKYIAEWDPNTGEAIVQQDPNLKRAVDVLLVQPDSVYATAYSPVGTGLPLATAGENGTVHQWRDWSTALLTDRPFPGSSGEVQDLAFSADGHLLAAGSQDGLLRLWNPSVGQPILTSSDHSYNGDVVSFDPAGKRFASAGIFDRVIRFWNSPSGSPTGIPLNVGDQIGPLAFRPGQQQIIAVVDGIVQEWNADTGTLTRTLSSNRGRVTNLAVSRNGLIATATDKGDRVDDKGDLVDLWNADTGAHLNTVTLTQHTVSSVAFSGDGHRLAVAADDGSGGDSSITVFDSGTGALVKSITTARAGLEVAMSPDGRRVAGGAVDGSLVVWNADTGAVVHTLGGHKARVEVVAFSPDGTRIASGGADNAVRLWDADAGKPIGKPLMGDFGISSLAFSPDGRLLVTGGDGVQLWPATATVDDLCHKLTANMSRRQWRDWISPDIDYMPICPGLPILADKPG